tara:strand:+ start:1436 stop:2059 length:624 start_codon:yes stop_codon:yes gene_type:complete
MKITYAITVCNEFIEIQRLLNFLLINKRDEDDIVVLFDSVNGDPEVEAFLRSRSINLDFMWHSGEFKNHFADWKNKLSEYCSGDYIFQIDADEIPTEILLDYLPKVLEDNPDNEVYLVARVNTVSGLTQDHINEWRWNVDDEERVNWPDYQWRIWKNKPEIKWINKVHEKLQGFKTYAPLPAHKDLALYHPKTIERQEKQNKYYSTL